MASASDRYKEAGVDIELATRLLGQLKSKLGKATRPEVLAPVGGFGGLFQIDLSKHREPVLVVSVDGVGTKLMIAAQMAKYDTVGFDIVNHCINDIAVQGAEPLYFLDYIGIGLLRSPLYEEVLGGIADACREQGVALLGGETAEMPGMYGNDFDLVGCITGVVEKPKLITGEKIAPGHVVIGLASNGLHTNGYSLARKAIFKDGGLDVKEEPLSLGMSIGEALLKPHTCYWPAIREALAKGVPLDGLAHITGGGVYDNIPRVMPKGLDVVLTPGKLPVPPIFDLIQNSGEVTAHEMYHVFNMGVGMTWMVPPDAVDTALDVIQGMGVDAAVIGKVQSGDDKVVVLGIDE